jgi:uncharacterized protein (TIGR03083 family)
MASTVATRELWLRTIRAEGDRLAAMPADLLDAPVPSVDGWTVERVVRHVGKVHRWVSGLLTAPPDADPDVVAAAAPSLPRGPACLPAYREALDAVVGHLGAADPDREAASFVGPTQVRFWLRRQAHEVSVHRIDAADAVEAAGGPEPAPLGKTAAADGIAEWVEVFAATRHAQIGGAVDPLLVGHTFAFVPIDVDEARATLRFDHDAAARERDGADADVVVAASAHDLLLTLWRRRPIDTVTVDGDHRLVAALLDSMRF